MPVKLATATVDYHGRAQIPAPVRRFLNLNREDDLTFWVVEERIVIDRSDAGTPNPFDVKAGYRPFK